MIQPEEIKRLTIIAMFTDEFLVDRLVLKGGNAIEIVHQISSRASLDIDFSMRDQFAPEELDKVSRIIEQRLVETFQSKGLRAFDVTMVPKPGKVSPDLESFWGGYLVNFKLIELKKFDALKANLETLRRNANLLNPGGSSKISIDISKFEYCDSTEIHRLDGFRISTYTPAAIVAEKIRAICQQMPDYLQIVKSKAGTARARDFVDIHTVAENFKLEIDREPNITLLRAVFAAKKVPIGLIQKIGEYRDYHSTDFAAVQATVRPDFHLKDFDFYFDYVVTIGNKLKTAGVMDLPGV